MIEFSNPQWLWGLLVLPVAGFALAWGARLSERETEAFTGQALRDTLAPGHSWRKNLLKGVLRTLVLGCIIVALAGPRFGTVLEKIEREGIDIVIALDTSLSMLAEDMPPSRLDRAKHEIIDLIRGLEGDRVGIVVFAGKAFALCPLTVDYDAALMFTQSIDVYTVSEPGTALDKAIETSAALFDDSQRRDRAIILVTDGENHEGDPHKAAADAAARKIRIFTIGIGNPSGELIPERGTDGNVAGYKKDKRGETVLTRLDEETLIDVASTTGGRYLPATRQGLELDVLYSEIGAMDRKTIKGEFVERRKQRFWIFLAAALGFLLVDGLVSARATGLGRRRTRYLHTGVGMVLLAAFVLLLPGVADARGVKSEKVTRGNKKFEKSEYDEALSLYREALGDTLRLPEDYQGVYYNEANTLYMQKRYQEALQRYQRSFSEDSTLTGRMLYNRANALVRSNMLQEAVESYVQSLQYAPDDEQTRHNLEIALRMLEEQEQQKQDQKQDGDQQDDQNKEQGDQNQQDQQDGQSQSQQNPDSTQGQNQEPQEGEDQQDQQQQQPDSTSAEPQPADSTAVPQPPLSEEDLKQLSREDAMRILQALEEQEKRLQAERRKAAFRRLKRSGKDW